MHQERGPETGPRDWISFRLLQLVGNALEGAGDFTAKRGRRSDDRNGDQRGEQGVFDGGRAGFIGGELSNEVFHKQAPTTRVSSDFWKSKASDETFIVWFETKIYS